MSSAFDNTLAHPFLPSKEERQQCLQQQQPKQFQPTAASPPQSGANEQGKPKRWSLRRFMRAARRSILASKSHTLGSTSISSSLSTLSSSTTGEPILVADTVDKRWHPTASVPDTSRVLPPLSISYRNHSSDGYENNNEHRAYQPPKPNGGIQDDDANDEETGLLGAAAWEIDRAAALEMECVDWDLAIMQERHMDIIELTGSMKQLNEIQKGAWPVIYRLTSIGIFGWQVHTSHGTIFLCSSFSLSAIVCIVCYYFCLFDCGNCLYHECMHDFTLEKYVNTASIKKSKELALAVDAQDEQIEQLQDVTSEALDKATGGWSQLRTMQTHLAESRKQRCQHHWLVAVAMGLVAVVAVRWILVRVLQDNPNQGSPES